MPPPSTPAAKPAQTLSQAFRDIARAASVRADEGDRIFSPIAAIWDDYLQIDVVRKLLARLRKPLSMLYTEISNIANKHFDAYLKGTYPALVSQKAQPSISLASDIDPPILTSIAPLSPLTSYAQVATIVSLARHQPTHKPPL